MVAAPQSAILSTLLQSALYHSEIDMGIGPEGCQSHCCCLSTGRACAGTREKDSTCTKQSQLSMLVAGLHADKDVCIASELQGERATCRLTLGLLTLVWIGDPPSLCVSWGHHRTAAVDHLQL